MGKVNRGDVMGVIYYDNNATISLIDRRDINYRWPGAANCDISYRTPKGKEQ